MQTAVLVDLDFFIRRYKYFHPSLNEEDPLLQASILAKAIQKHCNNHISYKENFTNELYRIYIYDCPPLQNKHHHPKTGQLIDFSKTPVALLRNTLHLYLKRMPLTALRLGRLDEKNSRWEISNEKKFKKLLQGKITIDDLNENDFKLSAKQKQVDMKIGMDITWLALKGLVDQIVLISGDSDFVPVAKLARREGIKFILDAMYHNISDELKEHIDFLRTPRLEPPAKLLDQSGIG